MNRPIHTSEQRRGCSTYHTPYHVFPYAIEIGVCGKLEIKKRKNDESKKEYNLILSQLAKTRRDDTSNYSFFFAN